MRTLLLFLILLPVRGARIPAQDETGTTTTPWSVKQLVEHHVSLKQNLGVQDVYKMLYQANFGVEHLLTDTAGVRSYLLQELASLDSVAGDEPLIERISTDGSMVRINLRPFAKNGLDPEKLITAMYRSAAARGPDTLLFLKQWREFYDLARFGLLKFPTAEAAEFHTRIERGEILPVHHSPAYKESNKPAYRVVLREVYEQLMQ